MNLNGGWRKSYGEELTALGCKDISVCGHTVYVLKDGAMFTLSLQKGEKPLVEQIKVQENLRRKEAIQRRLSDETRKAENAGTGGQMINHPLRRSPMLAMALIAAASDPRR